MTTASQQSERVTRVAHIRGLMLRGEWRGKVSAMQLAGEWACDVDTVRDYSAEASRQVALLRDDESLEQAAADREVWLASVERVVQDALSHTKTWTRKDGEEFTTPAPDFRAALKGLEMLAIAKGIPTTEGGVYTATSGYSALLTHLANVLPPDAYGLVVGSLQQVKFDVAKRLPSGVVVRVEREGEK